MAPAAQVRVRPSETVRGALEDVRRRGEGDAPQGRRRCVGAARRLATLDLPRAYVGQTLVVSREESSIARMRVIQRFSGRSIVVAELVEQLVDEDVRKGDTVTAQ